MTAQEAREIASKTKSVVPIVVDALHDHYIESIINAARSGEFSVKWSEISYFRIIGTTEELKLVRARLLADGFKITEEGINWEAT